ncbi:MAG: bifunctional diguanylate cyclase/phosphodiesterase [Actinobacteria bacterium]|nr:bifunctional diguanylate cyclase/phosphodiesterase [Actinomycetota bacterium]
MHSPSRSSNLIFGLIAGFAIVVTASQVLFGPTGIWVFDSADLPFLLLSFAATAMCVRTSRRSTGKAVLVWRLIALSAACNLIADIAWIAFEVFGLTPSGSVIDLVYLLSYPVLLVALAVLIRARDPHNGSEHALDGVAVVAGLALFAWQAVVVAPGGLAEAGSLSQQLLLVAYPLMDLLLLGTLAGLMFGMTRRSPALWGLFGYLFIFLVSDMLYAVVLHGTEGGTLLAVTDLGFAVAYTLLGVTALNGTAPLIADEQPAAETGTSRFVLLGAAVVIPSITAVISITFLGGVDPRVFAASAVAVALVLMVRVARIMSAEQLARRAAEKAQGELSRLALEDPLTGLPNRNALLDRLASFPPADSLALLFIDLDHCKVVNDTAGHAAGDTILKIAAARICTAVQPTGEVFRLSGDEFVALCGTGQAESNLNPEVLAEQAAQRVLDVLSAVFVIEDLRWFIGGSVGIAASQAGSARDSDQLIRDADVAMYEAKRQGRGRFRSFDQDLREAIRNRHELENEIRVAIDRNEIEAAFQPVVHLDGHEVAGFEALARWRDRSGRNRSAAEFIEVAEQTGLISQIDHEMLRKSCRFIAEFNEYRLDREPAWVSVNLSTQELAAQDLSTRIASVLRETGIDPSWLTIELTEGALTVDPDVAVRRLTEVHDLGVSLAVDDFGTGYSSLAHLLRFPVDVLKVDRIFVDGLTETTSSRSVAAAALQVAQTLGITSVAEGVETQVQADALLALGYDLAQGYLFARAMPATEALRLALGPSVHPQ